MSCSTSLRLIPVSSIPLVHEGDNLCELIRDALHREGNVLKNGDVLVIAQKIISKSEGRLVDLKNVSPGDQASKLANEVNKDPRLVQLILDESSEVVRYRHDVLVVEHKLGFVMANAGIDMSNVQQGSEDESALLLPVDPDLSARKLRRDLGKEFNAKIGVVINDSHGRAWRKGTVGVAIGVAGFSAVEDLRGSPDMFGRKLQSSIVGVADEIAAAASIVMGQAAQAIPAVVVRGLSLPVSEEGAASALVRSRNEDLFR